MHVPHKAVIATSVGHIISADSRHGLRVKTEKSILRHKLLRRKLEKMHRVVAEEYVEK